jgi:hypothetical protein
MLRMWRVKDGKKYTCCVSLENVESGGMTGFAALRKQIESISEA